MQQADAGHVYGSPREGMKGNYGIGAQADEVGGRAGEKRG